MSIYKNMENLYKKSICNKYVGKRYFNRFCFSTPSNTKSRVSNLQGGRHTAHVRNYVGDVAKRGYRGGLGPVIPRVLQQHVFSKEKFRPVKACNQFKGTKFLHKLPSFQNGDNFFNKAVSPTRGMGHKNRFKGCLFPLKDKAIFSKIPEIHLEGESLSVHNPTLRPEYCTQGFHGGCNVSSSLSKNPVFKSSCLPRRLVDKSKKSSTVQVPHNEGGNLANKIGVCDKSRKVSARTRPAGGVPGSIFQPKRVPSSSFGREHNEAVDFSRAVSTRHCSNGQNISKADWPHECIGPYYSTGKTVHSACPILGEGQVEDALASLRDTLADGPHNKAPSRVVGSQTEPCSGMPITYKPCFGNLMHRCIKGGMGSSPRWSRDRRQVGPTRDATIDKLEGAQGSSLCYTPFFGLNSESECFGYERQHDCCPIYKEYGRDQVSGPMSGVLGHFETLSRAPYSCTGTPHSRNSECHCRPSVKAGQGDTHRMVPGQEPVQSNRFEAGASQSGHVCHKGEPSTSGIFLSSTGQSSTGSGCPLSRLGDIEGGLCLPSNANFAKSPPEDKRDSGVGSSLGSTSLAKAVMVSRSVGTDSGSPIRTASVPSVTQTESGVRDNLPPDTQCVQLSRVDCIRSKLIETGFSEEAADRMSAPQRESTIKVYEEKWRHFRDWCHTRDYSPFKVTDPQLAEYFLFLFHQQLKGGKKRAVKTIEGYRAALAAIFRHEGRDLSSSPYITNLIKNFAVERPVFKRLVPQWNLALVLNSLIKEPYEPLGQISLQNLTFKTVFLLALASGRRRSEIHAFSIEESCLRFARGYTSVTLLTESTFLAKNQVLNNPPQKIVIPSLIPFTGRDTPEYTLCPVRSLKAYVARTTDPTIRRGRKRLFIPFNTENEKDLSARSISTWLSKVIRRAYEDANNQSLALVNIKAHEVRAMAASWAFFNNVPYSEIMQAAYWKGENTFSSFYLRSLSHQSEDLYSLGPIVSAQQVIQPPG